MKTEYILLDSDGDIVTNQPIPLKGPIPHIYRSLKEAVDDAEYISEYNETKISIYKLVKIIKRKAKHE